MNPTLKNAVRQFLPRALKPHHILGGPLRNYRIVTSWHDYPAAILGKTEGPLLDWFAQNVHTGETWLDIGAHYGYTALALAHFVGASGRVFAFEPMLTSAGCIAQTRRLNGLGQLTVLPLALGNAQGLDLERLPVVRGMIDSTLKPGKGSSNGSGGHIATATGPNLNAQDWQEPLLVTGLDELWQRVCASDARVHGIKVDVQGMELQVVRGMMTLLKAQHPKLVIEVHTGVSRPGLLDLMAQAGYSPRALPVEPVAGETTAQFVDDKSYAFLPQL